MAKKYSQKEIAEFCFKIRESWGEDRFFDEDGKGQEMLDELMYMYMKQDEEDRDSVSAMYQATVMEYQMRKNILSTM